MIDRRPSSPPSVRPERAVGIMASSRSKVWFFVPFFFGFAIPGLLAIQLPLVIASAGHRPFRIGAVLACQNGGIVLAPLWGWVADRLRAWKAVLVGSVALLGLSLASLAVERSLQALLISGVLLGVGIGACNTVTILLAIRTTPRAAWPVELATLQMLGASGSVAGFAVAGVVGSRTGMLTAAALGILAVLAAMRAPTGRAVTSAPKRNPTGTRSNHSLRRFALFLATWLFFSTAVSEFSSFYPITMARNFGIGVAPSAAVLALATLASLPLYGAVGRRIQRLGPAAPFAAGLVARAAALVVLATLPATSLPASIAAIGCAGVFQAVWPMIGVASSELSAELAPGYEGVAVGVLQSTGSAATAIGALLSGYIADRYGYQDVLGVASAVAIAAVICGLGLRRAIRTSPPVSREPVG